MVPRSLAAVSIGTRCGFGCGTGLGLWFFTGFGRHPHHGCRQHWCRLRMNAHRTYRPGGRLWAGHGPRSVQPHVLSSLRSLPGYPVSITQELVTLLPRLPTQATAKARAAAPPGCSHQERRLSPSSQPQAGEVRQSHVALLPPRHLGETGGCFSVCFLHFSSRKVVSRQADSDQRELEPSW